ncbi:MAG: hypothetical protein HRT44_13450, partial [Bdellovibrionales bacterium]|nr:hypothetical protein [Bdellovibrionales bacterium]
MESQKIINERIVKALAINIDKSIDEDKRIYKAASCFFDEDLFSFELDTKIFENDVADDKKEEWKKLESKGELIKIGGGLRKSTVTYDYGLALLFQADKDKSIEIESGIVPVWIYRFAYEYGLLHSRKFADPMDLVKKSNSFEVSKQKYHLDLYNKDKIEIGNEIFNGVSFVKHFKVNRCSPELLYHLGSYTAQTELLEELNEATGFLKKPNNRDSVQDKPLDFNLDKMEVGYFFRLLINSRIFSAPTTHIS